MRDTHPRSLTIDVLEPCTSTERGIANNASERPSISEVADKILADLLSDDPTEFLKANEQSSGQ